MTAITNAENLRQHKTTFSLIVEQMLTFASSTFGKSKNNIWIVNIHL